MSDEVDEKWHEVEKSTLLGSRGDALTVVSALRSYRAATKRLLASRYQDGECDAFGLSTFADLVAEIDKLVIDGD